MRLNSNKKMGKIKLKILWGQEDISKFQRNVPILINYEHLEKKYRFDLIQKIDFEGDDVYISLDIKDCDDKINWDLVPLPNNVIRLIINEFEYYYSLSTGLKKILSSIESVTFENRYTLRRLGDEALDIISNFSPSQYFKDGVESVLSISKEDIKHTLKQEIEMLCDMRQKASQRDKDDALRDAVRHLSQDISRLKFHFELIELKALNKE